MNTRARIVKSLLCVIILLATASVAHAQATRTWVSGVGDDANPCSRTAPCKTFAGAISKTAAGGEINVLDPGGFGGVTITKSITISSEGFEAGVLVSGTNAIIVNALSTDRIVLRGLDVEGLGTGLTGIKLLAGGTLQIENCTINNFTQRGIDVVPSAVGTTTVNIKNTIVRNNLGASSGGIRLVPFSTGVIQAHLEDVTMDHNQIGIQANAGAKVTIHGSTATNNAAHGFFVSGAGQMDLDNCVASNNTTTGLRADLAGAIIRFSNTSVINNGVGTTLSNSAVIGTFGNNQVAGNGLDINPPGSLTPIPPI